jgi:hypothetical protein
MTNKKFLKTLDKFRSMWYNIIVVKGREGMTVALKPSSVSILETATKKVEKILKNFSKTP